MKVQSRVGEKKDEKKRNKIKQFKTPGKEAHSIVGCLCSADCTIANHVGDKNGAKAEGGSTTGVKTGNLQIVSEEPNGLSIEVDDTGVVIPHTGETYEKSVTLIKDAQKVGKLQLPECKTDGGDAVALGAGFMTLDKQIQSTLSAGENLFPLTENVENDLAANAITEDRKLQFMQEQTVRQIGNYSMFLLLILWILHLQQVPDCMLEA